MLTDADAVLTYAALEQEVDDAKVKLKKEVTERKRLHNLVQELRGNIRVFCECNYLTALIIEP
jgi:kinesin family protein C2/C3